MANYILTNTAVDDLADIWNYTFEVWSENQADRYYQLLIDGFEHIAESPAIGRKYDEIENGLLGFHVAKHIIFYLVEDKEVQIIRILHTQMDIRQHIDD